MNALKEDWTLLRQDYSDDVKIDVLYDQNNMTLKVKAKKGARELEQEFKAAADPITYMPSQDVKDDYDKTVQIAEALKQQLNVSPI